MNQSTTKTDWSKCSLFQHCSQAVIDEVVAKASAKVYKKGGVLIDKGQVPPALFVIEDGKVGIYIEDILLAELGSMAVMGESFLAHGVATATIVAASDVKTIEIPRQLFTELAEQYPQLIFNIFTINFERLRSSNDAALREARAREQKLEEQVKERTRELNAALEELQVTNQELTTTRDNLIETQKFRDQFLANMSHEIRTPMNAIVGLTNLLINSPLNPLQEKYLHVIKKSGANLLVIINDILDLAKLEAGKMELEAVPFPLVTAIQNVHTILNLKAEEKGITLVESIDANVPFYVVGDETRITQVLMNLTGNAIKFTEKGKVTIGAKVTAGTDDEPEITFSVRDTGIGIPPDRLDKIFESFGQASSDTTRKYGGTGLGLTISKQLVEMHGGQLEVKSKVGEGSVFFFTVKYKRAEPPSDAIRESSQAGIDMSGKRILLVEDNEFNQMVAVDTLQELFPGIVVEVASNGKEAMQMAADFDYGLVFMDIHLPDFDGFEITQYIRNKLTGPRQAVRICAMTASVTKEKIDECYVAGMNDYLMKPFTHEGLKERIYRAFA
ncbi:MAG TPA: ATP-binding protein [Bacteroidia bacterium]|nr:ATP-binding protein [Bacteroidia bacterium]